MVILVFFNVLKIAKVRPLVGQKGPYNPIPTHDRFIFNLQFLYELKHKFRLSETVCGIFLFQFCFVFVKVYIAAQQNPWTL